MKKISLKEIVDDCLAMCAPEPAKEISSQGLLPIGNYYSMHPSPIKRLGSYEICSITPDSMHVIAAYGTPEQMAGAWAHGGKLTVADNKYNTPLHVATLYGSPEMVEYLLSLEAVQPTINRRNSTGQTALFLACVRADTRIIRTLLLHHAKWDIGDHHGALPLHIAVESQVLEHVDILLAAGADAAATDTFGRSVMTFLRASPESTLSISVTSAYVAASAARGSPLSLDTYLYGSFTEELRRYLLAGISFVIAKPGQPDKTALQYIAALDSYNHSGEIMRINATRALLLAGDDPNAKGAFGRTPLEIALDAGQHYLVATLLAAGAIWDE